MFRSIWVYVFGQAGTPAVAANPAAVPPILVATPAVPAVRGHGWAQALVGLFALAIVYGAVVAVGAIHWGWPFWNNQTASASAVTPTTAANAPGAVIQAIEATGDKDVYLEMLYGNGQSGRDLAAARKAMAEKEKADAEVRAAKVRAIMKRKAVEIQRKGAFLICVANEEAQQMAEHMEIVRRDSASAYGVQSAAGDIHVVEAAAASANYRQIRNAGIRSYYKGRRLQATLVLEEVDAVLPEVQAEPTVPAQAPVVKPPRP